MLAVLLCPAVGHLQVFEEGLRFCLVTFFFFAGELLFLWTLMGKGCPDLVLGGQGVSEHSLAHQLG